MRRQTLIALDDRGTPLTFLITEMSARDFEKWLLLLVPLLPADPTRQEEVTDPAVVLAAISASGLNLWRAPHYEALAPVLNGLLHCCVLIQEDDLVPCTRENLDTIITDVRSLFKLYEVALAINMAFCRKGARKERRFPRQSAFNAACQRQDFAQPVNISPLTATLITTRTASLLELDSMYSYADALNMLDVIITNQYTPWVASEAAKRAARR